jgi:hypothetical protein
MPSNNPNGVVLPQYGVPIEAGSLTYPMALPSSGNKLGYMLGAYATTNITSPVNGDLWFSFLVQRSSQNTNFSAGIAFLSVQPTYTQTLNVQFNNPLLFGVTDVQDTVDHRNDQSLQPANMDATGVNMIVGKISGTNMNVWLNPTSGVLGVPTLSMNTFVPLQSITELRLINGGLNYLDEFHMGTSQSSVMIPDMATVSFLGLSGLISLRRRQR